MKKRNHLLILALLTVLLFSSTTPVLAAKKRVWGKVTNTSATRNSPFSVTAKLTGWKQYLNISFRGLASTQGVNYEVIYTSNGIDQGGGGRVDASEGNNVSKSVFLGSCSHNVCTAHKNISNVRLTITYQTTSGQSVTKKYRVKYWFSELANEADELVLVFCSHAYLNTYPFTR